MRPMRGRYAQILPPPSGFGKSGCAGSDLRQRRPCAVIAPYDPEAIVGPSEHLPEMNFCWGRIRLAAIC